jgi:hypothetical protein
VQVVPSAGDFLWAEAYVPEVAALCRKRDVPVLIRATWRTRDGAGGCCRDLGFGVSRALAHSAGEAAVAGGMAAVVAPADA